MRSDVGMASAIFLVATPAAENEYSWYRASFNYANLFYVLRMDNTHASVRSQQRSKFNTEWADAVDFMEKEK